MKISAESMLGSARRINSQRTTSGSSEKGAASDRADRADIASKVDSRADSIANELKNVQTDLSGKQAVREGVAAIIEDYQKGGANVKTLLNEVMFNDKKVLLDYLGEEADDFSLPFLSSKSKEIEALIGKDMQKVTRLQVESENLFASKLLKDDKAELMIKNLNESFAKMSMDSNSLTRLSPESVMRLVK